jgi:hypothetical protein
LRNPNPEEEMSEPDYHREMTLPAGRRCDDCANAKRCFAFGFAKAGDTSCDFWPSRFRKAEAPCQDAA